MRETPHIGMKNRVSSTIEVKNTKIVLQRTFKDRYKTFFSTFVSSKFKVQNFGASVFTEQLLTKILPKLVL
jgi:hypothetical protein